MAELLYNVPVYVESSNLEYVSYDPNIFLLTVGFVGGGVYEYTNVPENVYSDLLNSSSKGKFFWANIRNTFSYERIV
jgi:hypothetical protein